MVKTMVTDPAQHLALVAWDLWHLEMVSAPAAGLLGSALMLQSRTGRKGR
jgi:hypothetical protein